MYERRSDTTNHVEFPKVKLRQLLKYQQLPPSIPLIQQTWLAED
jgi:hypothetical protein